MTAKETNRNDASSPISDVRAMADAEEDEEELGDEEELKEDPTRGTSWLGVAGPNL